jgi:RHS repeat-associated protein
MNTSTNSTATIKIRLLGLCFYLGALTAIGQNINAPNKTGPMGLQVNTQTGNLFFSRTDVAIPSRGFGVAIGFSYNSFNFAQSGPFGNGWSNVYNIQYLNDAENNKTIVWGDGREDRYKNNGVGYAQPTGFFSKLEEYEPGKFLLSEKDGTKFYFENAIHKRITKMTDPNGNALNFTYTDTLLTGITTSAGQQISLAYNSNGKLSTVTDANASPARTWSYLYDNADNLIRVTDPLNNQYRYSYLVNGPLKEVQDRNNNVVNIIYYADYTVSELIGCNQRISFAYDESTHVTVVTDHMDNGDDQVTKYRYKKIGDNIWLVGIEGNCCGFNMHFEYDAAGNKIKEKDANGNTTKYTYDENGNMLTITDALNQVYRFTYTTDYNFIKTITDPKGFTTEMTYDNRGNLLEIKEPGDRIYKATYAANGDIRTSTDPKGNIYTYTYDQYGNPATVSGPNNYTAAFGYDNRGQLISYTNSRNHQTHHEYDILSRLKKVTDPLNQSIFLDYDANGNVIQMTNPNNETLKMAYDASNRPVVLTDPTNQTSSLQYDAQDNLVSFRNVLGQTIQLAYDKQNRLKKATNNMGESLTMDYDNNGNLTQLHLPNGRHLQYVYDELDRVISMSDEHGALKSITYDANGNITSIKNGSGAITTATYDNLNRITQITDPLGNTTTISYDLNNRIVALTDPNGNTTSYTYDGLNRIVTTTDNLGAKITVGYDSQSNVTSLTDQNGNTTSYQYDALNRTTKTTYPDGKFMEYTYNNKSLITQVRLTDGTTIKYSYDVLNRLVEKKLPDGQVFTYTYDGLGRVLTATNHAGTVSFGYDDLNRLISETFNGQTVSYTYNTTGRTSSTIYPDGTEVKMEYDSRNRLIRVLENGNELVNHTFDNNNNLVTRNLANGVKTQYQFDIAGRLVGYSTANGSIQQVQIKYDKVGNKTSILRPNQPNRSEYFSYDKNYRLTQYQRGPQGSPNLQHTYTYDALGNRLSANIGGTTTTYEVNNLNQLTQKTTGGISTPLLYDANGNLRFDGKFYKTYDAEKRLLKDSVSPAEVYTYQYDAFGRRVAKTTNGKTSSYIFSGLTPIEERVGTATVSKQIFTGFLSPLSIEYNGEKNYYLQNELGSVEAITNAGGRVIERYEYDPYGKQQRFDSMGNPLSASLVGNRIGFTGQEYDSATAGNSFYFRNYNPELGVFQQRDLIGYGDGMGLYQYVGNNPANGVDVLGLNDCNQKNNQSNPNLDMVEFNENLLGSIITILEQHKEISKFRENIEIIEKYQKEIPLLKELAKKLGDSKSFYNFLEQGDKLKGTINTMNNTKIGKISNTLGKLGKAAGLLDFAIKSYKLGTTINNYLDGSGDGYDVTKAGGNTVLSGLGFTPVGAVYNVADFAQQYFTGKGSTDWAEEYGNVFGETGVDQSMDEELQEFHRKNGTLKKYLETKKRIEMREARKRLPNCPQNGNNGGTRKPSPYPRDPKGGQVQILGAYDPNEIIGPVGQPDKRWVSVKDVMPYTINFENDTIATAPAKAVRITAPVHPNMDPSKLELGSFGFNNMSFSIPAGTSAYYQRLDCRDSLNIFVDITAGYDVVNNEIFWLLQSIDPVTLQTPADPLTGLLLLQDTANPTYGHGFVNFTIKPRATAITTDTIAAQADIIFDANEVIPTNVEVNTIDAFAPTSRLHTLPANSNNPVVLNWSGQDDPKGCGVKFYTLYVSDDGINFSILRNGITRTDTTFFGKPNSQYFFFVLATDSVGNTEVLRPGEIQSTFIGSALPVQWLYFKGTNKQNNNLLEWSTAMEQNTKEFKVERSIDEINFKDIGTVKARGTATTPTIYNFTDYNIQKLNSPVMYYRLRQIDNDGKFTYSAIIRLTYKELEKRYSKVYPNPTPGITMVAIGDKKLLGTMATVIDLNGKVLFSIKIASETMPINLDKYVNGIYFIKLANQEVLKVMKQ